MGVKFLFFAQSAAWAGCKSLNLEIRDSVKLSELFNSKPEFAGIAARQDVLKVSVNCEFTDFDKEIMNGDEVAILPPVSGG